MAGITTERRYFAVIFLALAVAVTAYGVINAAWTRVKRISVKLPGLPSSWRGRTAVLITDVHLGNLRTYGFLRRIVKMAAGLQPDVVFIAGDLYDGTPADLARLAEPSAFTKTATRHVFCGREITKSSPITPNI